VGRAFWLPSVVTGYANWIPVSRSAQTKNWRETSLSATIEITQDIAIITMDDGKANAINPTMIAALNTVGRENRFSAGFDLKLMSSLTSDEVTLMVNEGGRLALRLYTFPMPVVCACTGHGIAMGSFILLASDIRIGTEGPYKIGANETAINMVLPVFAVELLKARIDPRHLGHAAINGHLYDPDGAVAAGFLDRIVPASQVKATAIEVALELSALTSPAYGKNKRLIRAQTIAVIEPSL
jgi:enoyl-CoA hydratase